jgi:hypothetical protein
MPETYASRNVKFDTESTGSEAENRICNSCNIASSDISYGYLLANRIEDR